jgi:carbonic anhydrase
MRRLSFATLLLVAGTTLALTTGLSDPHAPSHDTAPASHEATKPATKPAAPKAASKTEGKAESKSGGKAAKTSPAGESPAEASTQDHAAPAGAGVAGEGPSTPDEALKVLEQGNERWVSGTSNAPNTNAERRRVTAEAGQKPFVTVLTCADSRLPVERVFDRGVGDVFAIRVAGNVVDKTEAGTIEYGLEHLGTKLLVVMGHSKCGAVKAALTASPEATAGDEHGGNIYALLREIVPAVQRAKTQTEGGDENALLANAVKENVWQSVFDLLKTSRPTLEMVRDGKVKVVGAVYDLSSGKVEFLGEHPWQGELIQAISNPKAAPAHADAAPAEQH